MGHVIVMDVFSSAVSFKTSVNNVSMDLMFFNYISMQTDIIYKQTVVFTKANNVKTMLNSVSLVNTKEPSSM